MNINPVKKNVKDQHIKPHKMPLNKHTHANRHTHTQREKKKHEIYMYLHIFPNGKAMQSPE
jgi:hypothetical protein